MYLTREQTTATLAVLSALSSPGSLAVVTYMRTEPVPTPGPLRRVVDAAMGILGEPLRSSFTPGELASALRVAGFCVTSDEDSIEWARRFRGSARAPALFKAERMALAEREQ